MIRGAPRRRCTHAFEGDVEPARRSSRDPHPVSRSPPLSVVLTDSSRGVTDDALGLSEDERNVIQQALSQTPHPLAGFANQLVDQWDDAAADDRVAGLLLFSEIASGPKHRQSLGRSRAPGLGR